MAEEDKAAGNDCGPQAQQSQDGKPASKRAPDQDVLPGILGKQLKAAYGELLNAPIPDEFKDLISRLEQKDPAGRSAKPQGEESEE
jgi:Anti-sigma factor NepR